MSELERFIQQENVFGHHCGVEWKDNEVYAYWTTYLDDGYGRYLYARCEYDNGKIVVEGFTREKIDKAYKELEKECDHKETFECESCDKDYCETYGELNFLELIDNYMHYLENNLPEEGLDEDYLSAFSFDQTGKGMD